MEVGSLAVTGSLRIGLHIATSYKRPVLEIYHYVKNQIGPEYECKIPKGSSGIGHESVEYRPQEVAICFFLVNIGGVRAENVELRISGELKRNKPRESFGEIFNGTINQIAPGQIILLFNFDQFDLCKYSECGGSPIGDKDETFTIVMSYDAPGIVNKILSFFAKMRGKKQFVSSYTFSPKVVIGDLPPPEYV